MTKTISGHDAITSPSDTRLRRITVPGTSLVLVVHRSYAPVFAAHANDWHHRVETLQLDPLACWSYAYRPPNMGSGVSDHSGYAVDLNSLGAGKQGCFGGMLTMTRAQKEACRDLSREYGDVLFWGGAKEWGGQYGNSGCRAWDPMHWYVRPGCTPAVARSLMERLGINEDGEREMPLSDEDVERIAQATAEKVWAMQTSKPVDDAGTRPKFGAMVRATYVNTKASPPPGEDA